MVDINTKMITLIGTPLGQSFAARMQNAGYEAAGLNMLYFYTEADNEHLGDIVNGLRYMNFAGFAVTKPNKVKVLEYLDELDPLCAKMGASNTVVRTPEGKLIGYNTDGIGFYTSLTEEGGIDVEQSVFFCIGGGGAGRAICSVLAYKGARKIYITDAYEPCAKSLAEDINTHFAQVAEYVPYGDYSKLAACNVVINASGVGMGKSIGQSPCPRSTSSPASSILMPATIRTRPSSSWTRRRRAARSSTVWACPCTRAWPRLSCGPESRLPWRLCARSSLISWLSKNNAKKANCVKKEEEYESHQMAG